MIDPLVTVDSSRWSPCGPLTARTLRGRHVVLEPLTVAHADSLWQVFGDSKSDPQQWTYLGYGPFGHRDELVEWITTVAGLPDPVFFACLTPDVSQAVGWASLLRIVPEHGVVEVGHLAYSPALQRTAASTEIFELVAEYVFREGYRRLEWKCDARNERSRRAARRLGFTEEGTFRQHMIVKSHNRDTTWFALLDREWPVVRSALTSWLDPANFDGDGRQLRRLEDIRHHG